MQTEPSQYPQTKAVERRISATLREVPPWLVVPALAELERMAREVGADVDLCRAQVDVELAGPALSREAVLDLANELHIALEVHDDE